MPLKPEILSCYPVYPWCLLTGSRKYCNRRLSLQPLGLLLLKDFAEEERFALYIGCVAQGHLSWQLGMSFQALLLPAR